MGDETDGERRERGSRGEIRLAPPALQRAQLFAEVGKAGDADFSLVASPRMEGWQLSDAIPRVAASGSPCGSRVVKFNDASRGVVKAGEIGLPLSMPAAAL